jgi:hypothetical protein
LDAGLAGESSGEFLTTPLRMARAVLEGVLVDEPIEVVRQLAGHFGWATGAGAIHQAFHSLVGKAMDPLAQRGIGKVQRVGHRLEAVPLDDLAHSLGTAEDAGLLGLLEESIQGGESLIGKVEFEGPHSDSLQEKLLLQYTRVQSPRSLLSEQRLFDSNFPGAADRGPLLRQCASATCALKLALTPFSALIPHHLWLAFMTGNHIGFVTLDFA